MIPLINRIAEITKARDKSSDSAEKSHATERSANTERSAKARMEGAAKKQAYTQQLAQFATEFGHSKDAAVYAENTAARSLRQRQQLWHDLRGASAVLMSFDSSSEMNDDIIHVQNSKYPVIHPHGKWKTWWDLWIRLLILYNVIMVPYRIGFDLRAHGAALGFDIAADICFGIDMLLCFRTAFFNEEGDLVTDPTEIARRYMRSDFWVDLLSTFPFDYLSLAVDMGRPQEWRATKLLRMFRLAKLFRMLKAAKASRALELEGERFQLGGLWGLLELLLKLAFVAHIFGCIWHWVTILYDKDDGITWTQAYGIEHASLARRYAASVYYAYTTMSTIGYGDITPVNDPERGVALLAELVGASVFGYVIGSIMAMVANINLADSLENERLDAVKEYVQDRKFPRALASRIIRQYKYNFKHGSPFDSNFLLQDLPANTRTALLLAQYQEVISNVDFLQSSHPHFVTYFVQKMKPFFANRGEVLLFQGELGLQLFFVAAGSVALLVTNTDGPEGHYTAAQRATATQKISTIKKGSFFGAAAILLDIGQPYTAIATSFSEMYFVSREDILAAIEEWPTLKQQLELQVKRIMDAVTAVKQQKFVDIVTPVRLNLNPSHSHVSDAVNPDYLARIESGDDAKSVNSYTRHLLEEKVFESRDSIEEQKDGDNPETLWLSQHVIHPDDPRKAVWDIFMCVLIIYTVIIVTFRLSFNQDPDTTGFALDTIVDICFFIDILVTFRTAYYDDQGFLVTDPKQIAHTYLTGWFALDFISTVPLDRMLAGVVTNSAALRSTRLLRMVRLVRFVKVMRLLKVSGFFEKYEERLPVKMAIVRILKLMLIFGFAAHVIACLWFAVGSHEGSSWTKEYCFPTSKKSNEERCLDDAHVSSQYLASIYWAVTTMSTVGYGDVTPSSSSTGELAAAMVAQIISTTLYAYIVGTIVSLILNLNPRERAEKKQRRMFTEYMKAVGVLPQIQKTAFRQFAFGLQFKSMFHEQEILNGLPTHLRARCFTFLYRSYLPRLPVLCSVEERFPGAIMALLPLLNPAYYAKGDVIFSPMTDAREVAFLIRGSCDAIDYATNALVAHYRPGDHFGEDQILLPAYVPFVLKVEVRALTNVRVLLLSRHDFWKLKQTFPSLAEVVEQTLGGDAARDQWMHFPEDYIHE